MRWSFPALALLLVASACGDHDHGGEGAAPTTTTAAEAPAPRRPVAVRLEEVGRFEQPVDLLDAGGGDVYVVEQTGRVRHLGTGDVVLDLSASVSTGNEQGLLGLAAAPDGRHWYVDFTDTDGHTRVVEYEVRGGRPDPGTAREVLFVEQPYANHNGGDLAFGPDGDLYVSLGDGGSGGDPQGNAQDPESLLGKIVRLDPSDPEPEIAALGLRNPWRISFDRETGDLWIGDVGQSTAEEVDRLRPDQLDGANLGWDLVEGTHRHEGDPPPGHVPPVHEYLRTDGACAVTGGFVYRGDDVPGLAGRYVFGDFCVGEVMALDPASGRVRSLGLEVPQLSSFGEGGDGELYALSLSGPVLRLRPA